MVEVREQNSAAETELSARQRHILKVVVQEYVGSAEPVGSETVRQEGEMDVSSATIRNELSRLEDWGYLDQPHTSAGRVPTVAGYRYFVEQLMGEVSLPVTQQRMISHQFHQMGLNLDQWVRLTASVLAHVTRSASLVTPPHASRPRVKHVELISIQEMVCLMIIVLEDGSIHQEMLVISAPIEQEELRRISDQLNARLVSLTADEVEAGNYTDAFDQRLATFAGRVIGRIVTCLRETEDRSISEIHREGLVNVFQGPEFEDAGRVRQVLSVLEQRRLLETILTKTLQASGVQIIIGGEGPYEEIYGVSMVLSPYGVRNKASGVLGIIGPRRMSYARAVSTVRYVAHLMDDLVGEVYGV